MIEALTNAVARIFSHIGARPGQNSLDAKEDTLQPLPCPSAQIQGIIPINIQSQPVDPADVSGWQGLSKEGCDETQPGTLSVLVDRFKDLIAEREEFLRIFGDCYGYHGRLQSVRHEEFRRLAGQVYLDYAGAALYSERQIQACSEELLTTLLCNPHSAPASTSADAMSALRRDTLELLNADGRQYEVIITSGATAALKMVAECFPWSAGASCLAHPAAVHNSVLGMRGPALAAGAAVQLVQLTAAAAPTASGQLATAADSPPLLRQAGRATAEASAAGKLTPACRQVPVVSPLGPLITADGGASDGLRGGGGGGTAAAAGPSGPRHLLALPVECNFTGDRQHLADAVRNVQLYGIDAVATAAVTASEPSAVEDAGGGGAAASGRESRGRWLVLLDAAKACATAPPDLSVVPADFVVLSYYKIFGYPTGLGALVARKDALALLAAGKSYFGGGTVEVAVADRPYHVRRQGAPGFEDGTPPFTSIAAARHGFAFLHRLGGLPAVHRHSCCLARWLTIRLAALRHANGTPVCMLYGRWCSVAAAAAATTTTTLTASSVLDAEHGPTVSFNLLRPDGSWVGYTEVGRLAAMHGLVLRTGCFCNPGACAEWLGLTAEDLIRHHKAGHVCWDDHDLADGRPTGAVRVSLGAVSTFEDVHAVLQLIRRYFVHDGGGENGGSCTGGGGGEGASGAKPSAVPSVALSMPKMAEGPAAAGAAAQAERQQPLVQQHMATQALQPLRVESFSSVSPQHQTSSTSPQPPTGMTMMTMPPVGAVLSATQTACGQNPPKHPSVSAAVHSGAGGAIVSTCSSGSSSGSGGSNLRNEYPCVDQTARGGCTGRPPLAAVATAAAAAPHLSRILFYPVKSCAPQVVQAWPIGPTGLLYDREWALVDDGGKVLTLKQCPRMALVRPVVDLTRGTLTIHAPHDIHIPPLELAIPGLFHSCRRIPQVVTGGAAADLGELGSRDVAAAAARGLEPPETAAVTPALGTTIAATLATAMSEQQQQQQQQQPVRHGRDTVRLDAGLTMERVQVCGDTVCSDLVDVCHDSEGDTRVRQWFGRTLGAPCRIVQQRTGARKVRRPAGQGAVTSASAASSSGPSRANNTATNSYLQQQQPQQPQQQQHLLSGASSSSGGGAGGGGRGASALEAGGGGKGAAAAEGEPSVGFANDGQYLLVSEASMDDLRARLRQQGTGSGARFSMPATATNATTTTNAATTSGSGGDVEEDDLVTRLRPNLVVSGFQPYEEDSWAAVRVGPLHADVLGTCPRCELLQVDPRVGVRRGAEVLVALAQYRRRGGKVQFGVLLAAGKSTADSEAAVGPGRSAAVEAQRAGVGVREPAAGGGSDVAAEDWVDWLRREFGQFSVVAVGDPVAPTTAPR